MSSVFTDRLMGIYPMQILNKIVTCNDRDATWITPKVKTAIRRNSRVYWKWIKHGSNIDDYKQVQNITNKLIKEAKQLHYKKLGDKLSDLPKLAKKYFGMHSKEFLIRKDLLLFHLL